MQLPTRGIQGRADRWHHSGETFVSKSRGSVVTENRDVPRISVLVPGGSEIGVGPMFVDPRDGIASLELFSRKDRKRGVQVLRSPADFIAIRQNVPYRV